MKRTLLLLLVSYAAWGQTIKVNCNEINDRNAIDYKNGEKTPYTGDCVSYYPNGKKSFEGSFKNGKNYGTSKWYHENGQIKEQIIRTFIDSDGYSRPEGKAMKWFQNGNIMEVVNYKSGQLDGEWYELDIKGKKIKKGLYKNGKLINGDKYILP